MRDARLRCQECGRLVPKGRSSCAKCGSTDVDLATDTARRDEGAQPWSKTGYWTKTH